MTRVRAYADRPTQAAEDRNSIRAPVSHPAGSRLHVAGVPGGPGAGDAADGGQAGGDGAAELKLQRAADVIGDGGQGVPGRNAEYSSVNAP